MFAFGGYFVAQSGHVNQVSATAWLPWLVLALDRGVTGDRRAWLALPPVTALMLLAGHPQVAYMSLLFGLVYAVTVGGAGGGAAWRGGDAGGRARAAGVGGGRDWRGVAGGRAIAADAGTFAPWHPVGRVAAARGRVVFAAGRGVSERGAADVQRLALKY